jgi:hypothetical protein
MLPYEPKPPGRRWVTVLLVLYITAWTVMAIAMCVPLRGQSFYGCGISALPQSSPKPTGWCAYGAEANVANKIWSISEMDFVPTSAHPQTIQTSVQTGAATPLRTFGRVTLYGMGTAGAATTGTSAGSAFSGGGLFTIPIRSKWLAVFAIRILKTTTNQSTLIQLGVGRTQ